MKNLIVKLIDQKKEVYKINSYDILWCGINAVKTEIENKTIFTIHTKTKNIDTEINFDQLIKLLKAKENFNLKKDCFGIINNDDNDKIIINTKNIKKINQYDISLEFIFGRKSINNFKVIQMLAGIDGDFNVTKESVAEGQKRHFIAEEKEWSKIGHNPDKYIRMGAEEIAQMEYRKLIDAMTDENDSGGR